MKGQLKTTLKGMLGAAALLPVMALADASNFDYVEGGYLTGKIGGVDVHGWGIAGRAQVAERFFVQGAYSDVNLNETIPGFRFDSDGYIIGVGYIFGENSTASVYGTVSYVEIRDRARVGIDRFRDRYDGYDLGLGVRINLIDDVELKLGVNHTDLGRDGGDATVPSAELVYQFTPQLAGVASYSRNSDDGMLGLGFRFYF